MIHLLKVINAPLLPVLALSLPLLTTKYHASKMNPHRRRRNPNKPIQPLHRTREIASQIGSRIVTNPVRGTQCVALGTRKSQRSRTTTHDVMAEVVTRKQFLVRARLDFSVDHRNTGAIKCKPVTQRGVIENRERAICQRLSDVAGVKPRFFSAVVFAAGEDDGAEPVFVVVAAVVAVAG
ncbi:unnamed protein product [Periconia digitata]|uniref:Secreted protein n=1 Tax=Periconia digitata TaxID=1303443 RepID=A0A9W4UD97_9PLEO|nr:unnamed protein product [Periconia digitata]